MTAWLVFALGGIGTYLIRASFLALGDRVALPERVRRSLAWVAPAVFAAIVAPPVLGDAGLGSLAPPSAEVVAAALAGAVAWRTGRVTWVLVVGMVALWVLRAIGL